MFVAPEGWSDEHPNVDCQPLPVHTRVEADGVLYVSSFWLPNAEEYEQLMKGGAVRLSFINGQPPVAVDVSPLADVQPT